MPLDEESVPPLDVPPELPMDPPLDPVPDEPPRAWLELCPRPRVECVARPEPRWLRLIVPDLPERADAPVELDPLVPLVPPELVDWPLCPPLDPLPLDPLFCAIAPPVNPRNATVATKAVMLFMSFSFQHWSKNNVWQPS